MGDIASAMPKDSLTVGRIYEEYAKFYAKEAPRDYLGASIAGHECKRFLWYTFRDCVRVLFSGRMYRLFETGHREEERFVKDLRAIGCEVHDVDENGEQFSVCDDTGHIRGHFDGVALGIPESPKTWHLLEFKTHNAKSFARLLKNGVEKSKPVHYAQVQLYMHLGKLTRALYLAKNKDTEELYSERIRYDKKYATELLEACQRAVLQVDGLVSGIPDRIASRPDFYLCNMCDARDLCWGLAESALPVSSISCRQCCHSTPVRGSKWTCTVKGKDLSRNDQLRACDGHLLLPMLFPYLDVDSYDQNTKTISYRQVDESGQPLSDSPIVKIGGDGFSSKEVMELTRHAIVNPMVGTAKRLTGGTVSWCGEDLLEKYTEEACHVRWKGPRCEALSAWRVIYGEKIALHETPVPSAGPQPPGVYISKTALPDHTVFEFPRERVLISWNYKSLAEIREKIIG